MKSSKFLAKAATVGAARDGARCGVASTSLSTSYLRGYTDAHDYYSIPENRDSFQHALDNGYNAAIACRVMMAMGPQPLNEDDWLHGCVDAMHDVGLEL